MSALRVFLARLRSAIRSHQLDRDLRDEIDSHLAEATEEYVRHGLAPDAARQQALRQFGGVALAQERYREARSFVWLDDLRQDLRHTVRSFLKNPTFTFVVILTLALGIGANATIFTLLDAVVFKPLPVRTPSELVTFFENGPEGPADAVGGTGRFLRFSYPRFERLRAALGSRGSIAAVTRSSQFAARLPGDLQPQFLLAQMVSGEYFSTLGVAAARGRLLTADDLRSDQLPAAVVSDAFWHRRLGGTDDALGKAMVVNGVTVTVIGVAPRSFVGLWTDREADIWLPLTLQPALHYQNNSSSYVPIDNDRPWFVQDGIAWLNLVARVQRSQWAEAVPILQAANRDGVAELASRFQNPKGRTSMLAHTLAVEPFSHGFSGLRARFSDALFALTAMVVLVLLVTCANIANLLLARAAAHARDVGIRISLGATTSRLVRQCLTESVALALLGGAAGVLFSMSASQFIARQAIGTSGQLPIVFTPDRRVVAFVAAVSMIAALVFGLVPALRAIGAGRRAALAPNQRQGVGPVGDLTMTGMRSLVVAQLALSVVVVFAALLLGRTLINFMRIDPGFPIDRLVTAAIDPITSGYTSDQMSGLERRLVDAARAFPGVTSAVVARCGLVAGCASSAGFRVEGGDDTATFYENWVGPGYFATVGIPIASGRDFDDRDTARGLRVAIVNESIARRFFNGQNPIGKRIGFSQLDTEIVGVARDARTQTLHDPPVPMAYFPLEQRAPSLFTAPTNLDIRVATDPRTLMLGLREVLQRAEPNLLIGDVGPMSARLARDLSRERIVAYLAISFGGLALLLASIGLYGVLAYGVTRRTPEIGVRMALGARPLEVLRLVAGQSVRLTALGIVLGLLGTVAAARSLSGMLFGVAPLDPVTFFIVIITFVVVTTLASYMPARRATRVDPIAALRVE